jgi:uncharacterized protein (TIGR02246 family)
MDIAMHTKSILALFAFVLLEVVSAHAQESTQTSPDEQSIRKSVDDYCAAFNNNELDSILAFWADDADYVDVDGETHRGKESIGTLFKISAADVNGNKLGLKIDSLRFVKPEVAIEDGTATLTDQDGETTSSHYTAVWVKNGDKWLIQSARELPSDDVEDAVSQTNADYIQPLDWLVGQWVSDDSGPAVNLNAKWALDKNFLMLEYAVAGEAGNDVRVIQWVGFDPLTEQIKSWTFDSRGGYGDGLWTREENTWHVDATGVLPDGRIGTVRNTIRFVDETHFELHSTGRNVEGQPMPDVVVKFVRSDAAQHPAAP